MTMENFDKEFKPKSFWKRPEGTLGAVVLLALLGGAGYLLVTNIAAITAFMGNVLGLAVIILALGALLYMALDPKMRNLISYVYKSTMRKITSLFITIDPIGILKNYIEDLEDNLEKLSKQIGNLMGQSQKLSRMHKENEEEIEKQLTFAQKAREMGDEKNMLLSTRKAARLKDVNQNYAQLLKRMDILKRVLKKMYSNSEVLLEDTRDQVKVKEVERKAIRTSHSAMKSAMNIIAGNSDKRLMFDAAVEHIADDVANKVGEMERMMELSNDFMNTIDLQNGAFEEKGLQMLEEFERKSSLLLLDSGREVSDELILKERAESKLSSGNSYDNLFNEEK
jgi:phage shock protein A